MYGICSDSFEERFWSKVEIPHGGFGCWRWAGSKDRWGYGRLARGKKRDGMVGAHRAALELSGVRVPDEMCVLHECDQPDCVNPSHLSLGTHLDNARDKVRKGRAKGGRLGSPVLKDLEVEEIRRLRFAGLSERRLGRIFGISRSQIGRITRNEQRRKPTTAPV